MANSITALPTLKLARVLLFLKLSLLAACRIAGFNSLLICSLAAHEDDCGFLGLADLYLR